MELKDTLLPDPLEVMFKLIRMDIVSDARDKAFNFLIDYYQEDNNTFDGVSMDYALRLLELDFGSKTKKSLSGQLKLNASAYVTRYMDGVEGQLEKTKTIIKGIMNNDK